MLSDDDIKSLDVLRGEPDLSESLNLATMNDPDKAAESLGMPISNETYQANKPQIDRSKKLDLINIESLKKSHPKTSSWLTDKTNASIAIDDLDILKGIEDTMNESERGFINNTGRGVLKSVNQLTGNLIEFVGNVTDDFDDYMVNSLGMPNPGIVFGDDGVSWSWDIPPEKTGIEEIGAAISSDEVDVYDYRPDFTWENLKGDVTPTNLAGYVVEQGFQSLPHMMAALYTLPAYIASRTEDIAEKRVTNDDRDDVTGADLATSFIPAVVVAISEKLGAKVTFGAGKAVGVKGVAKAGGVAAATEGVTEFIQEGIEYIGETAGTEKKMSWAEGIDRSFAGMVAGAGMGGGIRTTTATIEAIGNKTEQQALTDLQSMSEQETIDQVVSFAQSSTTNGRSTEHFEDFVNSLGEDKEVLIPNEVAEQMVDAPDYITEQLNDLGVNISVPLKKFAGEVALNEEWMGLIRPHIKLSSNTLSQTEIDDADRGEIQELLKRAKVEQETITEADRIFDTVKDQLKETKMQGEATARHSAALYPAYAAVYVEKARKAGHDITMAEAFEMMGFSVEAGDVDVDVTGTILDQPAYKDAPEIFESARDKFLDTLPEDATVDDVFDSISEFSSEYRNFINSMDRADWLGFDHPSQAINAALSEDIESYDIPVDVKRAIGTMINAELAGEQPFAQTDIPDDLEITMESEAIETGDVTEATYNAKELSTEIDDKLDSYQKLLDCLQ